ncbi:MAG: dsDNA nuclease domain-containing protein [Candidatus Promineifilaceae bacterium]
MTVHIISTPQLSDQGSEGSAGYDYQKEFALMLCIDMLLDKNSRCVICEFHEDVVQISRGWEIDLIQVKKKENGNWSLNDLIKPDKKQTQGIMAKLLSPMQQGKAIRKIRLAGYGKVTPSKGDGNLNLAELVTLLKTPQVLRKNEWLSKIQEYQVYLAQELQVQSIRADVIEDALQVLEIDFSSPHPEAIALDCHRKLTRVIKQIWDVSITHDEVTEIYHDLYSRIKGISNKPRQPWNEKAITRQEVTEIVGQRLRNLSPAANRKATMNTQDKLTSVGLGSKSTYAFQKRLDAIGLRYELGLSSSQWEDFKTEISCACEEMRMQTPGIKGATLWKGLRKIFHELGNSWSVKDDKRLNSEFVEGVFFDMTGVCEASWMKVQT